MRGNVVSKVVPYIAMELYQSDEVGKMIADFVNAAMYHGKCTALEEIASTGKPVDLTKVSYYRSTHAREYDDQQSTPSLLKPPKIPWPQWRHSFSTSPVG